jgi:hypothetical protein
VAARHWFCCVGIVALKLLLRDRRNFFTALPSEALLEADRNKDLEIKVLPLLNLQSSFCWTFGRKKFRLSRAGFLMIKGSW